MLGAPSQNVAALQTAINRIGTRGGWKITVDGGLGPQTNQGTLDSLLWINSNADEAIFGSVAGGLVDGVFGDGDQAGIQTRIAQQAVSLTTFINGAANSVGIPKASVPNVSSGGSSGGGIIPSSGGGLPSAANLLVSSRGWLDSIKMRFKLLPVWQKVGLGAGTALALLWASGKMKSHRASK